MVQLLASRVDMHAGPEPNECPTQSCPALISAAVEITDDGLVIGAGSLLARMAKDIGGGGRHLALDTDRDRLIALLSVAIGRPVAGADVLHHIEAAAGYWQRGDKALANLRLVFAGLPRLSDPADAYRLCLAEHLLDEGLSPNTLMKELGFGALGLAKYNRDEARVAAGSSEGGQWTFGPSGASQRRRTEERLIVAAEGGPPEDQKTYEERRRSDLTTPDEDLAHGRDILHLDVLPGGIGPGPYTKRSIPAGPSPRPDTRQQLQLNTLGREDGCHTCGTKDPGTKSGNFIGDHQPPNSLNSSSSPQYYFPQCLRCSRAQGGLIKSYKSKGD